MLAFDKYHHKFYQSEEYWSHNPIHNSHFFLYEFDNNPWKHNISWSIMKRQLTQLVKEEEE